MTWHAPSDPLWPGFLVAMKALNFRPRLRDWTVYRAGVASADPQSLYGDLARQRAIEAAATGRYPKCPSEERTP